MYLSLRKKLLAAANTVSNCVGDDPGARVRIRLALAIGVAVTIGATIIEIPIGQAAFYYVDVKNPGCSDTPGSGTTAKPYCSARYAASIAVPGDTFLIQAGVYSRGPTVFSRSGTTSAPITYRAVGDVVFAVDIPDGDFQPVTGLLNVYVIPWATSPGQVSQTKFAPILVDDPNQSIFTMVQEDGPLRLNSVTDDATLVAREGTWRFTAGQLFVHAYGHRVPSTAATDFLAGGAGAATLTVDAKAQYNVFDGFRVLYTFNMFGSNNTFRNLKFQTQQFSLGGNNNTAENISVAHGIVRSSTRWSWDEEATGGGVIVEGAGHTLRNIHIFHNFNSGVSTEGATGLVVDGIRAHGAPNHCSAAGTGNAIVRNAILYNCQDYVWLRSTNNFTFEHLTVPSGIGVEGLGKPLGPIIVRNSIFGGTIAYIRGPVAYCTWEKGSIMENNVISTAATIERCGPEPMTAYPILEYMAKCASGEFTNCMTIRNNRMVAPTAWKTVMKDGMWNATLGDSWDVNLVPNSPAIDAGMVSGATRDILGVSRPKGSAFDIGPYEYCESGCSRPPPAAPAQVKVTK